MATLGNILERRGGQAMTPRRVALTLAIPSLDGGPPLVESVEMALLPVSPGKLGRAIEAARSFIAEAKASEGFGDVPSLEHETLLRFVVESARDPDDLRKAFVSAKDVDKFRAAIVSEQLVYLMSEYRQLLTEEYPELAPPTDRSDMLADSETIKAEARAVFPKGQG